MYLDDELEQNVLLRSSSLHGKWFGDTKEQLREHFRNAGHADLIEQICGRGDVMDYYQEAIRNIEQEQVLRRHLK